MELGNLLGINFLVLGGARYLEVFGAVRSSVLIGMLGKKPSSLIVMDSPADLIIESISVIPSLNRPFI